MVTKYTRWIVLAALFVIPFLVLYVSDSLYFPFITGKGFAFRILVEIAVAGYAVLAIADKKYRPQFSWTLALYGALVVWMVVADALAVSPGKAFWSNFERMDGWVTLIHVFAFFVITGAVFSADKLWRSWWLTFLASSALVSFYGLFQIMGVFQIHQGGVRLDATLGNAEYLAGYLLFAIAIALWQAMESKGWLKYTLYALAALHVVILYFTETRGAAIALVGAVGLGAILWMFEAGQRGRRAAGALLVIVIILVGGFFAVRNASWVQHTPTLSRLASISLADGQTRFTIWHMALEGFAARPVTGWGQEGFNYIFNTYYEPSLYAQEPWFDRAHNVLLDWLTSGGLPALLLFLALLGSAAVAFYRGNVSRTERVILIVTLAAYVFQGLFVFDNLFTYIPLAALLALAHGASSRPSRRMEALPAVNTDAARTTTAAIAAVAFVVVCWFVNIPNIAAAQDLIVALSPAPDPATNLAAFEKAVGEHSFAFQEITEQLSSYASALAGQSTVSSSTTAPAIAYALQEMGQEAKDRPADARILLEYSLTFSAAGDLPDALKETSAALALSPKKQEILIQKGTLEWQTGDLADAKTDFATAYALAPGYDTAADYAAAGDIITGDVPGGQALLAQHFGTTTVASDVLVYAYYQAKAYPDMVQILEVQARTQGTAQAVFQLASGYTLVGRIADARALITAFIQAHPEDAAQGQQFLSQLAGQ